MDYSYYSGSNPPSLSPYGLHGLPTPDQNQTPRAGTNLDLFSLRKQNDYDNNSFDPSSLRFDPAASFVPPPPHSPPRSNSSNELANNINPADSIPVDGGVDDQVVAEQVPGRSSSEEKDGLIPPKSRRKEQNRAAQRAFRERKERHVRDLEEKVAGLEQFQSSLEADNARLKNELARSAAENDVLRATLNSSSSSSSPRGNGEERQPITTGPMKYTPTDFFNSLVPEGEPARRHRVAVCGVTGERLLDAGSTWDLIQGHELFQRGEVDIVDVCERLKRSTQCNGQGPAFREGEVRRAMEESAARGRDELI